MRSCIEREAYVFRVKGRCWDGDCDCNLYDGKRFTGLDISAGFIGVPFHEGCVCILEKVGKYNEAKTKEEEKGDRPASA